MQQFPQAEDPGNRANPQKPPAENPQPGQESELDRSDIDVGIDDPARSRCSLISWNGHFDRACLVCFLSSQHGFNYLGYDSGFSL